MASAMAGRWTDRGLLLLFPAVQEVGASSSSILLTLTQEGSEANGLRQKDRSAPLTARAVYARAKRSRRIPLPFGRRGFDAHRRLRSTIPHPKRTPGRRLRREQRTACLCNKSLRIM
jgi:hypothetical protein